ncbi:Os01g0192201 [Oryza sativa Japonica Group]|nr:hypothetical protein OsJ_00710 [Oryza sativa Japonica Group]BAS70832.1 Os01g0192201 [Oryza sativa Japonica Group]
MAMVAARRTDGTSSPADGGEENQGSSVVGCGEENLGSELGDWRWERVGGGGRCTRLREHMGDGGSAGDGSAIGGGGRHTLWQECVGSGDRCTRWLSTAVVARGRLEHVHLRCPHQPHRAPPALPQALRTATQGCLCHHCSCWPHATTAAGRRARSLGSPRRNHSQQ